MNNCNCGKNYNISMGCCVPVLQDADNYYTKQEVDDLLDDIVISGDSITSGEVQTMIDESISGKTDSSAVTEEISAAVSGKQDTLVSGTNIKTINNQSLLGSGNIDIEGGSSVTVDPSLDSGSTNPVANSAITDSVRTNIYDLYTDCYYGESWSASTYFDGAVSASVRSSKETVDITMKVINGSGGLIDDNLTLQYVNYATGETQYVTWEIQFNVTYIYPKDGYYIAYLDAFKSGTSTRVSNICVSVWDTRNLLVKDVVRNHVSNENIHVTSAEKSGWDNKVNISDNVVSAYTINGVYKYGSNVNPYSDKGVKITEFYCKQNNTNTISSAYVWSQMRITDGNSYEDIYCGVNASGGVITAVTYASGSFNHNITNDGRLKVTLYDGWYVHQLSPNWNFDIYYPVIEIASGQTADVINNDLLDIVNETYQNIPEKYLTGDGSFSVGSEYVNLYLSDNKGNNYTKSFALGNGLKGSDNRINVVFSGQTAADKVLNTGDYNYCQIPQSLPSYSDAFDTLSIVFNSGYTGGQSYFTIQVRAIRTNGSTSTNNYQYTVASNSLAFTGGNDRITFVQDTTNPYKYTFSISDDYKSEWKIRGVDENDNCSIAGIDKTYKDGFIITAVTTPSYEQYGQDIIDDIYDKIDDKQDALSNASVLSGISSSDISSWNSKVDSSALNNYLLKSKIWCGSQSEWASISGSPQSDVLYLIHE